MVSLKGKLMYINWKKKILVGGRKFRSSQEEVTLYRDGKRYRLEAG